RCGGLVTAISLWDVGSGGRRGRGLAAYDLAEHGLQKLGNVGPLATTGEVEHTLGDKGGGKGRRGSTAEDLVGHLLGDDGQLARLNGRLEPLLPLLVEDGGRVAGIAAGSLGAEALIELDADALNLFL